MKPLHALPPALLLGACVAAESPPPAPYRGPPPPRTYSTVGLERVMGQTARGLTALFGAADADVTEGAARKLQFGSQICVLDAYLYARDGKDPVVTHVDARQRDGSAIDRASCVAALSRRDGGK
jgi:hypothetical protein